jgi:hypothetical protein
VAARLTLPVSGLPVTLRRLSGVEDILLAEGRADDPSLALILVESLAGADTPCEWDALPIPDVDAIIVAIRRSVLGDRVIAESACVRAECGSRVDFAFRLSDYIEHHRPKARKSAGAAVAPEASGPDWFNLDSSGAMTFRIPRFGDLIVAASDDDPAECLARRCVRPATASGRQRARAERTMSAMAPALSGPIRGRCPDCGAPIEAQFDARVYCLQELCDRARFVYDDVDALASRHHWSESAILELPSERRVQYAERGRQARLI